MTVIEKTKKVLITSILALVIIAVLAGGAYWYHVRSLNELREEMIAKQEQNELLEQRVRDIQTKLNNAEQENQTLLDKIDAMLTEDVYFFDAAAVMEKVKEIGELATVEYRYTNVGTLDASKKLFKTNFDLPGTKKTVVMTMDGVIKVGVDVNGIKISANETSKTIIITLPKAKLLSNELDENSLQIFDETSGLFNPITLEDNSALRNEIKIKSEENAQANGVYELAEENAKNILRCILEAIPGLKDTYTIQFN